MIINLNKNDFFLTEYSDKPVFAISELSDFMHIRNSLKIKINLKNGVSYIIEYTSWEALYNDLNIFTKALKKANL